MFSVSCLCVMATGLLCNSMLPVVSFLYFVCLLIVMRIKKKKKTVLTLISVSYATGTEDNIISILSGKRYLFGSLLSVGCMTILKCPIRRQ